VAKQGFKETAYLMGLLLEFAFTMLGTAVGGYFLDQWLKTKPYCTVAGIIAGGVVSIRLLLTIIKKGKKTMEEKDEPDDPKKN
jgi:F0F1-type ATP synthase assembly protein I